MENQSLFLVDGQRGKKLLVVNGYTLAKNNCNSLVTYWNCRHRTQNIGECRARARTTRNPNGLYTITLSKSHNHTPNWLSPKDNAMKWEKMNIQQKL